MDLGILGRKALVLGSSQGLGYAIARTLVSEGAGVTLTGRSSDKLAAAAAALAAGGAAVATEVVDLSDAASVSALVERIADRAIDILVLNSGGPPPGPVSSVDTELWTSQFATMVSAPLSIAAAVVPGMRARRFGRVVAIVSSGVQQPIPNLGISNALRASIVGWAKTLAGEVAADGVTVNCVLPGRIHTSGRPSTMRRPSVPARPATTSRRLRGRPSRWGAMAIRRNSPTRSPSSPVPAAYITGTTLRVDGGMIRSI